MKNEAIGLGIIGTGIAARLFHLPALKKLKRLYRIRAVANRTFSKAESFAGEIDLGVENVYADYHDLIARDDVEVILVAVPPELNLRIVGSAMQAGKDVICEKPVASSLEDANEMTGFPEKYGRKLFIAENFRYERAVTETRRLLDEKRISEPFFIIYTWMQHVPHDDEIAGRPWRLNSGLPGGVFSDHGIHMVDVVRFLAGDIAEVNVLGASLTNNVSGTDTAAFQMVTGSGTICTINWSFAAAENDIFSISLWSKDGHMEARPDSITVYSKDCIETINLEDRESSFYYELLDFHGAIKGKKVPLMTLEEGVHDLETMYRSYNSITKRALHEV